MKEVTREEFYKRIEDEHLDLVVSVEGYKSPYTNVFKFRNGQVWGKVIPTEEDSKKYPKYPWYENHYYIM